MGKVYYIVIFVGIISYSYGSDDEKMLEESLCRTKYLIDNNCTSHRVWKESPLYNVPSNYLMLFRDQTEEKEERPFIYPREKQPWWKSRT